MPVILTTSDRVKIAPRDFGKSTICVIFGSIAVLLVRNSTCSSVPDANASKSRGEAGAPATNQAVSVREGMVAQTENANSDDPVFERAKDLFLRVRRYLATHNGASQVWHTRLNAVERKRLGGSLPEALAEYRSCIRMWMQLHGVSYQRAVIDLGESLNWLSKGDVDLLLREGGELPRDPDMARDEAIQRGCLVVDRRSREVYWQGELIEVNWNARKAIWEFLVIVCEHAQRGEAVDRFSFGEAARANIVTQQKSALKGLQGFPLNLIGRFERVGIGTQKLSLSRDQIHIV